MNNKTWKLVDVDESRVCALARELGISEAVARVYLARGIETPAELDEFTNLSLSRMHDPFLLPDMEIAIERTANAVLSGEPIFVYGDADADGVTSATLLVYTLESLGANVRWYIPNRIEEGFGLSAHAIKLAHEFQAKLIITTDCGTEAFEAADLARELRIDLIITDHHMPLNGSVPRCFALVNPHRDKSHYPFVGLAGVGVALKFALALCQRLGFDLDDVVEQLVELVALGTVADVAPMIDENRVLVAAGCKALSRTNRPGLRHLIDKAGIKKLDTTAIGFYLAPRLNCVWRMSLDPSLVMRLLLTDNEIMAGAFASQLNEINHERRELQEKIVNRILMDIPDGFDDLSAIVLFNDNCNPGLNGLVANFLTTTFNKPAYMCALSSSGSIVGSCRSIDGYDALAALKSCSDILTKFGGHRKAAGFELSGQHFVEFSYRLNEHAKNVLAGNESPTLPIDTYLLYRDINLGTYEHVIRLAPFGAGNPEPLFASTNLTVEHACTFGGDSKHLKLKLSDGKSRTCLSAIAWRQGELAASFPVGAMVDVAFKLGVDDFRKKPSLMLTIEDLRASR